MGIPDQVEGQNYGFGVKAGFSAVTQTGNFIFSDGNVNLNLSSGIMAGYSVGFFTRLMLNERYMLVAELNLVRFGASYDDSFQFQNQEISTISKTAIRYIQIPVLIEWHTKAPDLGPYRYQRPFLSFFGSSGFYGGYRLDAVFSGKNSAEFLGVDFETEFSNNVTDTFKAFDAGLILGGGIEYGLKRKYGFETRLVMGLLDVGKNAPARNIGVIFGLYFLM